MCGPLVSCQSLLNTAPCLPRPPLQTLVDPEAAAKRKIRKQQRKAAGKRKQMEHVKRLRSAGGLRGGFRALRACVPQEGRPGISHSCPEFARFLRPDALHHVPRLRARQAPGPQGEWTGCNPTQTPCVPQVLW